VKLSIVFATLNRIQYLPRCLDSVYRTVSGLDYEVIVADGGSTDGTLGYLREEQKQNGLRLIEQGKPLGCVRAFNECFALAKGEYVFNFNDDAELVGDALVSACNILDQRNDIGQIAIPYAFPQLPPEVSMMKIGGRLVPYANFAVTTKCLGDKVGWWGGPEINLYRYAGDNQLSMNVWASGCKVLPLPVKMGSIIHYAAEDATRLNSPDDTTKFYSYWKDFKWD